MIQWNRGVVRRTRIAGRRGKECVAGEVRRKRRNSGENGAENAKLEGCFSGFSLMTKDFLSSFRTPRLREVRDCGALLKIKEIGALEGTGCAPWDGFGMDCGWLMRIADSTVASRWAAAVLAGLVRC